MCFRVLEGVERDQGRGKHTKTLKKGLCQLVQSKVCISCRSIYQSQHTTAEFHHSEVSFQHCINYVVNCSSSSWMWEYGSCPGESRAVSMLLGILPTGIPAFLAHPAFYLSPEVWLSAYFSYFSAFSWPERDEKQKLKIKTGSILSSSHKIYKSLNQNPFEQKEELVALWARPFLTANLSIWRWLENCQGHSPGQLLILKLRAAPILNAEDSEKWFSSNCKIFRTTKVGKDGVKNHRMV